MANTMFVPWITGTGTDWINNLPRAFTSNLISLETPNMGGGCTYPDFSNLLNFAGTTTPQTWSMPWSGLSLSSLYSSPTTGVPDYLAEYKKHQEEQHKIDAEKTTKKDNKDIDKLKKKQEELQPELDKKIAKEKPKRGIFNFVGDIITHGVPGIVESFRDMVVKRDENGKLKPNWGGIATAVGIGLGVAAIEFFTGGLATPYLATIFMGLGAKDAIVGTAKYFTADTREEQIKDVKQTSNGIFGAVTSFLGLKAWKFKQATKAAKFADNIGNVVKKDGVIDDAINALKGNGTGNKLDDLKNILENSPNTKFLGTDKTKIQRMIRTLQDQNIPEDEIVKALLPELEKLKLNTDPAALEKVMNIAKNSKGKRKVLKGAQDDLRVLVENDKNLESLKPLLSGTGKIKPPILKQLFNNNIDERIATLKSMQTPENAEKISKVINGLEEIKNATDKAKITGTLEEINALIKDIPGNNSELKVLINQIERTVAPELQNMISNLDPVVMLQNTLDTAKNTAGKTIEASIKHPEAFGFGVLTARSISMSQKEEAKQEKDSTEKDEQQKELKEANEGLIKAYEKKIDNLKEKADLYEIDIDDLDIDTDELEIEEIDFEKDKPEKITEKMNKIEKAASEFEEAVNDAIEAKKEAEEAEKEKEKQKEDEKKEAA